MDQMEPVQTKDQRASAYLQDLRGHYTAQSETALATNDFPRWLQSAHQLGMYSNVASVRWIFDLPGHENSTFDGTAEHVSGVEALKPYEDRSERLKKLVHTLTDLGDSGALSEREGHLRIILQRYKAKDSGDHTMFEVAALLPEKRDIRLTFSSPDPEKVRLVTVTDLVPCTAHAMDVLYKSLREGNQSPVGVAGYLPTYTRAETWNELLSSGRVEIPYMDPVTRETRHNAMYNYVTITGGWDNVPVWPLPIRFFDRVPRELRPPGLPDLALPPREEFPPS